MRSNGYDRLQRQVHLLLSARLLCGHGVLRPDASCMFPLSGPRGRLRPAERMSRTAERADAPLPSFLRALFSI